MLCKQNSSSYSSSCIPFPYDSRYTCSGSGKFSTGHNQKTITCLSNGTWEALNDQCRIGCPATVPAYENAAMFKQESGTVNADGSYPAGSQLHYKCNQGFLAQPGEGLREDPATGQHFWILTCGARFQWEMHEGHTYQPKCAKST